jgi:hypothetical protein
MSKVIFVDKEKRKMDVDVLNKIPSEVAGPLGFEPRTFGLLQPRL